MIRNSLKVEICNTGKYKYSKDNRYLTDEQRDFFEENGYLIVPNLINNDLIDECTQRFVDICDGKVNTPGLMVIRDRSLREKNVVGQYLINKVEEFGNDEILSKYMRYEPLLNMVESIIGPNITGFHTMLINKPPNVSSEASRHPMHQDVYYFPWRPVETIVAAWTAMQDVDEENGCLFVVPGSHKNNEIYEHGYPANLGKAIAYREVIGIDTENLKKVYLPMNKGDTIFINSLILHGSGPNKTEGFRKCISVHYTDSFLQFVDVSGTIQEAIEKEIENVYEMRKTPMVYQDIWKAKSWLVRGPPGTLQQKSH